MTERQKGLHRLGAGFGKIGRIFVPRHVEHAEKQGQRQRIVSGGGVGLRHSRHVPRDGGREAHKNKLAAKRHAARKIATASRRRNRGT